MPVLTRSSHPLATFVQVYILWSRNYVMILSWLLMFIFAARGKFLCSRIMIGFWSYFVGGYELNRLSSWKHILVWHLESKCLIRSSFDEAYGNDGNWSRSTHSKSPARPPYTRGSYSVNDNHNQNRAIHRNEERDAEKRRPDLQSTFSQTLEELELEYKRDAMDIGRIRDKEEDEENYRHRKVYSFLYLPNFVYFYHGWQFGLVGYGQNGYNCTC